MIDYQLPQIVIELDSPRARKTDPITSHEAADGANLNGSQSAVYWALSHYGQLAGFELEALLTRFSGSRVRSALSELAGLGLVEATDETRLTPYGRRAIVWQVA